jgi:hypothetical protein
MIRGIRAIRGWVAVNLIDGTWHSGMLGHENVSNRGRLLLKGAVGGFTFDCDDCGCNSVVEYLVANEVVVGSSPITRSFGWIS